MGKGMLRSTGEQDPLSSFGLPRSRRGRRVFFAVQWSVVVIVLVVLAIAVLPQGENQVILQVVLPAGIMLLVVLAVVMIFPSLYIPAAIRERALRREFPAAFIGTVLLNSSDRDAINTLRGAGTPQGRMLMTVGLSADTEGLKLWRGVRELEEIASLAWSQVDTVSVTPYVFSGRILGALEFVRSGGQGSVTLSLVTKRWLGMSPSRPRELDAIALRLNRLLPASPQ